MTAVSYVGEWTSVTDVTTQISESVRCFQDTTFPRSPKELLCIFPREFAFLGDEFDRQLEELSAEDEQLVHRVFLSVDALLVLVDEPCGLERIQVVIEPVADLICRVTQLLVCCVAVFIEQVENDETGRISHRIELFEVTDGR